MFVRWEICHWTLLWKRISLWNYCSVLRKRSDEGPSISCLIISCMACSKWTSFLLPNLYSHSFLFRVLRFIEISWYFSKNWATQALKIFSVWYLLDQTQYLVLNMKYNQKLEIVLKDDWFEFQFYQESFQKIIKYTAVIVCFLKVIFFYLFHRAPSISMWQDIK